MSCKIEKRKESVMPREHLLKTLTWLYITFTVPILTIHPDGTCDSGCKWTNSEAEMMFHRCLDLLLEDCI